MSIHETKPDPFISPPYADCPECSAREAFGVLMVNRRNYVRRCHQCRHMKTIPLPAVDRRLVYLDQLALSNLAKARGDTAPKTNEEHFWRAVLDQLSRLVRLQLVSCPLSTFHEEEGLVWSGYEALRAIGRLLSAELEFHDYTVIRNGQLYEHAQLWEQGRGDEAPSLDVDRVIEGDRQAWQPRLLIDARLPIPEDLVDELNRMRAAEDEGLTSVWTRWAAEDMSFDDRFQEEARSYGRVLLELIAARAAMMAGILPTATHRFRNNSAAVTFLIVQRALEAAGVPRERVAERAAKYLGSDSLVNVPFNRISSLLYAALARRARAGQKGVSRGMTNDVRMLSTLLPYCDAVFVDRECHALLTEKPISERIGYGTQFFSYQNKEAFVTYLEETERSTRREHLALVEEVYGPI
ncbi:MAG: hypothetical protein ACRDHO_13955 [Actinomycetota bacterium]